MTSRSIHALHLVMTQMTSQIIKIGTTETETKNHNQV